MRRTTYGLLITAILALGPLQTAFSQQGKVPVDASGVKGGGELLYESYSHQSAIRNFTDKSLGEIAKEQSPVGDNSESYGFAAKSDESKFFLIGSLYSETLACLNSGDTKSAAERLKAIELNFIALNVPRSLYNYISKMRNVVERGKYDAKESAEFLSLFQPFFEDYAGGQSEDRLILFRAGSWLLDMGLTAASGDLELLRQAKTLAYFRDEMGRMDAPEGVLRALDDISRIVEKEKVTDRDAKELLKLLKKIQTILG